METTSYTSLETLCPMNPIDYYPVSGSFFPSEGLSMHPVDTFWMSEPLPPVSTITSLQQDRDTQWINNHISLSGSDTTQCEAQYAAECLLHLAGMPDGDEQEIDVVDHQLTTPKPEMMTITSSERVVPGRRGKGKRHKKQSFITHKITDSDSDNADTRVRKVRRRSKLFLAGVQSGMISDFDEGRPGAIHLTAAELKFYDKLGMHAPVHGPLSQHQIKDLKQVRKRIQQQLSQWCAKQKRDEYVHKLEVMVKSYAKENERLRTQLEPKIVEHQDPPCTYAAMTLQLTKDETL